MSVTKPMKEVSVEDILLNYNLIVPEIQREYVWGYNEFGIFETFIKDLKEGFELTEEETPDIIALKQTINNPLIDAITKNTLAIALAKLIKPSKSINIGFLYSYKPSYYIGNDREEDLYLIDGQQRFTTLFLVLFYFSIKENRKSDFIRLFKFDAKNEKIAFDYRVRSITHQFIFDLIISSNNLEDLIDIRNKQWFLLNYQNDVTIKSIVGANKTSGVFNILNNIFSKDESKYFDYVNKEIKFWHFKTEETSQGEELYITMNSRGQQLADNETIRAKLFDSDEVKESPLEWSEKWELWQDFFWKHRNKENKDITADEGFNEFLRLVQILKMYSTYEFKKNSIQNEKFIKVIQWESGAKLDVSYLTLQDIELCFKSLKYLFTEFAVEVQNKIIVQYKTCKNFDLIQSKWLSPEKGVLGQIDLFQILPILLFCNRHFAAKEKIDVHNLYRFIRICYGLSKDETIGKAIRNQISNILLFAESVELNGQATSLLNNAEISKTILNKELRNKLSVYAATDSLILVEDLFWHAEDLNPYDDGEMSHLIKLATDSKTHKFSIPIFNNIVKAYELLLKNEDKIWGNLINTDVYIDKADRVEVENKWYKKSGFLNLVENKAMSKESLESFIINHQKAFISNYNNLEEMLNEASSKNQIYIYYILCSNNFTGMPVWNWNDNFNFGKWSKYTGFQSLFTAEQNKTIYQLYNLAFAENEYKMLTIQLSKYKNGINLLVNWSKK